MGVQLFQRHQAKMVYMGSNSVEGDEDWDDDEAALPNGHDVPDRLPRLLQVGWFDIAFYLIAMGTYVLDVVTDVVVAYSHYHENRIWAATFIAIFCFMPSVILNTITFVWLLDDDARIKKREGTGSEGGIISKRLVVQGIICLFQAGPLIYYYKAMSAAVHFRTSKGMRERRLQYGNMIISERDATLLRFFEAFMESAPQLLVQGFLLAVFVWTYDDTQPLPPWVVLQIGSVVVSLLSVSWTVSIQHRILRISRPDKENMHPHESVLQLIWRSCTIFSRYLVLITFCLSKTFFIIPVFLFHFVISVAHIAALQTVYVGIGSQAMELALIVINACIHFFTPFNMADGRTRFRYTVAYAIEFSEGVLLYAIALVDPTFDFPYKVHFAVASLIAFVVGIATMVVYYSFFHPNMRLHSLMDGTAADHPSTPIARRPRIVSQDTLSL